jgi:predicted nucleic acid-binding protein
VQAGVPVPQESKQSRLSPTAVAAGDRLRTFRRSYGIEVGDAFIASTAVELGATLIIRNVGHYPMPGRTVLRPN